MPCRRISQRPWQPATNRDLGTRQAAIHSEGPKPKGWWYTTVSSGTYTFIYIYDLVRMIKKSLRHSTIWSWAMNCGNQLWFVPLWIGCV
jgi:hypothetical protein